MHGLTQVQLGELIGVDASTVGAWEAGYMPNSENAREVKKYLR